MIREKYSSALRAVFVVRRSPGVGNPRLPVARPPGERRRRKGRGFEIEVRDQKSEVSQRPEGAADGPSDL